MKLECIYDLDHIIQEIPDPELRDRAQAALYNLTADVYKELMEEIGIYAEYAEVH